MKTCILSLSLKARQLQRWCFYGIQYNSHCLSFSSWIALFLLRRRGNRPPCPYCFLAFGKVTAFFTPNKHLSVSNCSKKICSTPWSARCYMLPMTRGRPKSPRKPMMGQKTWVMMFDQSNQTSKKTFDDSVARRVGSEIFTHFIWAQSMKRGGHRGYENVEIYLFF